MTTERITFHGAQGDRLAARLDRPVHGPPRAWALFAHCFTCSKDLRSVRHIARALNQEGIAVLRFDFTGLGESEGDFADTSFSSNIEDLVAAGRFMEEGYGPPQLLIGHSLGGAAVLHAAHQLPSVRAVATLGAPSDPAHVLQHFEGSQDELEQEGQASVSIAGRSFRVKKEFVEDIREARMEEVVGSLKRALLILHSPVDAVVGIDHATRLFKMARHPRSFISLDDADHLLLDEVDARYAGQAMAGWASRYMGVLEPGSEERDAGARKAGAEAASSGEDGGTGVALDEPDSPMEQERVVSRTPAGGFRTDVWADGHYLLADEPKGVGGTDEGPTPYDLLGAALATCTTMTLRMYADRKGWPLEEARVAVRHKKVHMQDEKAATSNGKGTESDRMDRLEREVELVGALTDEQRERLLEIANRCPVHRTLSAGVHMSTALRP